MCRVFKDDVATVRVYGTVNQEKVEKATKTFLKGVEDEKKRNKKETT